ncbi:MAG: amidohydrolase family protein, partial [Phycisphaeraceae bacterium]
ADACGVDQIVFGSHLPEGSAGAGIAAVVLSELTEPEQRQVAGGNLARLLGEREAAPHELAADPAKQRLALTRPYGFVDVHGHLRENVAPTEEYPGANQLVEEMDRTGIALCWISSLWTGPSGNDLVAEAVRQYPDRLVPFAAADPRDPNITQELTRCFEQLGMKAIKVHPVQHQTPVDDACYEPIWRFADERRCLVVTHARCFDAERDAFIDVACKHPDMTLMLYHAGRTWEAVDNFIAVARACPNVLLEITFSNNLDGIIEYLVERVGVARVFFGTDIGVRAAASQVGWALGARLDETVRQPLMRDNGLNLLRRMGALPQAHAQPAPLGQST